MLLVHFYGNRTFLPTSYVNMSVIDLCHVQRSCCLSLWEERRQHWKGAPAEGGRGAGGGGEVAERGGGAGGGEGGEGRESSVAMRIQAMYPFNEML